MSYHVYRLSSAPHNTFVTPNAAIKDALVKNAGSNLIQSLNPLVGHTVAAVDFTDNALTVHMDNARVLRIEATLEEIVARDSAASDRRGGSTTEDTVVRIEWDNKICQYWDRARTVTCYIGKPLKKAFYNGSLLTLYFEGCRECLCISRAIETDQRLPFLYWFNSR